MDKLLIKNMSFHAYHGEFQVEGKFGQNFEVDVELYFDIRKPGQSDDIHDTIDVFAVYEMIEQIMVHEGRYNLIEALAETIAARILAGFDILHEIVVRVRKTKSPVKGLVDYAEIEIRRNRQ